MNYAGWIDPGFSPFGDERYGIGRAFLFGMQLGVRVGFEPFRYRSGDKPSPQMVMVRDAARLMARCEPYLLSGQMLHDPKVSGSPMITPPGARGWGRRAALPIHWPVVQATAWRSASGTVCYALANLSDKSQTLGLEATRNGMTGSVRLARIDSDGSRIVHEETQLPKTVTLTLEPWQMCCIEQTRWGF